MLSLIVVTVVAALSASFLQLSSAVTRRQARARETKEAFYLADAGLAEAYAGMVIGKTGNVGSAAAPVLFGHGMFWVTATAVSPGVVTLESTGVRGNARVRLDLVLERGAGGMAALGIFADEALEVPAGAQIDGFDSSAEALGGLGGLGGGFLGGLGRGGTDPEPVPARVGSNGDVIVRSTPESPTEIVGDVAPGPSGHVVVEGDAVITGSTVARPQSEELPPPAPPVIPQEGGLDATDGQTVVLPAGEWGFTAVRLAGGAELVIQGPSTLLVDTLRATEGAALVFDTSGGAIALYVRTALELAAGTAVQTTVGDATRLAIDLAEAAGAVLDATGAFHGVVYAPRSTVSVGAPFELFGALVAQRIQLANGVRLHFDQALLTAAVVEEVPAQLSWRIVEMAALVPGATQADPFRVLGLDRNALGPPAAGHADQLLEIEYVDGALVIRTYTGMESAFDWTDVVQVIEARRDGELVLSLTELARLLDPASFHFLMR
ncbi:MAG: hypothetical protein AB1726_05220 [Planctomycetota bacterium]